VVAEDAEDRVPGADVEGIEGWLALDLLRESEAQDRAVVIQVLREARTAWFHHPVSLPQCPLLDRDRNLTHFYHRTEFDSRM
jgi:hypothetical protein